MINDRRSPPKKLLFVLFTSSGCLRFSKQIKLSQGAAAISLEWSSYRGGADQNVDHGGEAKDRTSLSRPCVGGD